MKTHRMTFSLLLSSVCFSVNGVEPETLFLWPEDVPGEVAGEVGKEKGETRGGILRLSNVTKPSLTVFPADPAKATGTGILVCPGGGYNILAYQHEGSDVCRWLNSLGVTGFLLKYRVPRRKNRPKHEAPLQDAQRALGMIRQNAKKWKLDPGRLGILGFSAGGNLSVMALTLLAISNLSLFWDWRWLSFSTFSGLGRENSGLR